jgi:citrate lyase subunit beta/citryl-CoA lyase
VNGVLTPGDEELRRAVKIVAAFEAAREKGGGRVELSGALVEVPTYSNAKRLIARAEALRQFAR